MHPLISRPIHSLTLALGLTAAFVGAQLCSPVVASDAPHDEGRASVDETITEFLNKSAFNRLAAIEVGRIAQELAPGAEVKTYAKGMVSEESLLLERLQALAAKLEVKLPASLNEKSVERLSKLQEKSPEDFEKAFWNFLADAYERDLVNFDFASKLENLDVRQFAVQYRSMFERQLSEIKNLQ